MRVLWGNLHGHPKVVRAEMGRRGVGQDPAPLPCCPVLVHTRGLSTAQFQPPVTKETEGKGMHPESSVASPHDALMLLNSKMSPAHR